MRALRPRDPVHLGGHRLLARLGAGGMGVVYLARATDGRLVALKVIRAEHAADPTFRARFRREVNLAAMLTGRWVVPVTAADPEAREPWLATAFIPGPSLAEAVEECGQLPARTVLALGAHMAEALSELHAAGLLHRDVKPGNILLARNGPRLIDFGIAHGVGVTALTAPEAVIGTPGYLSPEQARAGDVGTPSDVFSLGCVLAYAATAQRPFGSGDPAAVLYRTVHETPDLTGLAPLPPAARAVVARCLAKDPGQRPTAGELRNALVAVAAARDPRAPGASWGPRRNPAAEPAAPGSRGAGASRAAGTPEVPSTSAARATGPEPRGKESGRPVSGSPTPDGEWLPPAVLRLVAERSTRALSPPPRPSTPATPEPPALAPPAGPHGLARGLSRRRILTAGGSLAAVLATGSAAALLATRAKTGQGRSAPRALPTHTIGLQADLTGGQKETAIAQERGARLAVDAHNARRDARFRLALTAHDDQGTAEGAEKAVRRVLAEPSVRAVIGPVGETALQAAEPLYTAARMPIVLVSHDGRPLSTVTTRTLCVTRVSDDLAIQPLAHYLSRVCRVRRTAVIQDRAAGQTAWSLTRDLQTAPPGEGTVTVHSVAAEDDDFRKAVTQALAEHPQAVVYAGESPGRAAAVARVLRQAGFTGVRTAIEPVMRPAFVREAGEAAEQWVCSAPYTEPASADTETAKAFTTAHRTRYGHTPGRWAAEAYDAVGLIARTLDALGAGNTDVEHSQVAERLFHTTHDDGVAKPIRFLSDTTHSLDPRGGSFLYQVRDRTFRFLGPYDQVRGAGQTPSPAATINAG
ncbi:ABC transporter substrate-binding protein [Streptomyces sp. NPDC005931]|uniref:bifunctional serine/threonine-protein kinase/ABC transporter substrate-binding protein n=1 Tax=Streptomyces sp. NPDC005931 TaxID=3364737 RepID=UPI0036C3B5F7